MGKYIAIAIIITIIAVVSMQTVSLFRRERDLNGQLREAEAKKAALNKENMELQAQMDYLSHDRNLEKEIRGKFNYRRPDEKIMIVTP